MEPGDIAYNKMRAWQGAAGLSWHRGIVSPAYIVMRPREGGGVYLHHVLRTPGFAKEAERWSYGITSDQWSLRSEHFKMIYFPFPPEADQAAIVKYLGHANARIDRAIAAKHRLIALLEEQKRAVINQAVTRGLDPTVSLKDSGILWLRNIPEPWVSIRLKREISRIEQGWSPQCDAQPAGPTEWGVLKAGCANHGVYRESENKRLPDGLTPVPALEVQTGDVIVSRANTRKLVGSAALVGETRKRLMLSDKLFRFRTNRSALDPEFLILVLQSGSSRAQIESLASGASHSMLNIGQSVVRELWFSLPSLSEQRSIVEDVRRVTGFFFDASDKARAEIKLLREFRTRLTADVVTGQLDIRAAAARLPELNPADLMSDIVESDGVDLDVELAESFEEVDA